MAGGTQKRWELLKEKRWLVPYGPAASPSNATRGTANGSGRDIRASHESISCHLTDRAFRLGISSPRTPAVWGAMLLGLKVVTSPAQGLSLGLVLAAVPTIVHLDHSAEADHLA